MRKIAIETPGIVVAISFAVFATLLCSRQRPEFPPYLIPTAYDLFFAAHARFSHPGGDGVVELWSTQDWTEKALHQVTESEIGFFGIMPVSRWPHARAVCSEWRGGALGHSFR